METYITPRGKPAETHKRGVRFGPKAILSWYIHYTEWLLISSSEAESFCAKTEQLW